VPFSSSRLDFVAIRNSNKYFEPDHTAISAIIGSLHARSPARDSDARHAICCHPEVPLERRTACFAAKPQFYASSEFHDAVSAGGFCKVACCKTANLKRLGKSRL
jgi:hypothetical protein